jgi:TonB family protein
VNIVWQRTLRRVKRSEAARRWPRRGLGMAALATLTLAACAQRPATAPPAFRIASDERAGSVPTRDGLRLRLTADTGSVQVLTDATGEVRYEVTVEAAAGDPVGLAMAKQFQVIARPTEHGVTLAGAFPNPQELARVQVHYLIHVPPRYDLAISTQAGEIVAQDLDGRVTLSTGGGDIRTGRVGNADRRRKHAGSPGEFAASLSTAGGHIVAGDIYGGLRAVTVGGHITAGNVFGDAVLRTGGGHIQVGRVSGTAQLFSGGGNIIAERADSGVVAETLGGRIEFGTAAGMIRTHTGGGELRIAHLTEATQLTSGDGAISLAGVDAPVRVSTSSGSITAWLSPRFPANDAAQDDPEATQRARHTSASVLASGQGDVIVYLPRQLAVTIDARIERGSDHRIVADPGLPLEVNYEEAAGGSAVRALATMNGGGPLLHLEAMAGNIQLHLVDGDTGQRVTQQQKHMDEQRLQEQRALLVELQRQKESDDAPDPRANNVAASAPEASSALAPRHFASITRVFEDLWWGGVVVSPDEEQKHLIHAVAPVYPEVARQAGIEGDVSLRILIGQDGTVTGANVLGGEPVLARAAVQAIEQWRYQPALLDGSPVNVVTTVTLAFRLR